MKKDDLHQEFDRQLETLIVKGYPEAAGVSVDDFKTLIEPLKQKLDDDLPEVNLELGTLPFVIVITSELVPTETAMSLVTKDGKEGVTKLFPREPADFQPISEINIPHSKAYLLFGIDRGRETLNVVPSEAFELIKAQGRSPLTIDEGVAIVTQFPEFLIKNNCFSLLASRIDGDKRVPAIWINAGKQPNLGWCWNGNPHTWLGSASCLRRIA